MRNKLCSFGFHKWNNWEEVITEHFKKSRNGNDFSEDVQYRVCSKCSLIQRRVL